MSSSDTFLLTIATGIAVWVSLAWLVSKSMQGADDGEE